MSGILYDLYFGKINPWEKRTPSSSVEVAVKKMQKTRDTLYEQISENLVPLLEALFEAESEMHSQMLYAEYINGFKTGVKLMSAVFADNETASE